MLPTTEELAALLIARDFPVTAWDDWTVGMLINYCHAYDRMRKRQRGENVTDPEEQYRKLKAMQPGIMEMYKKGQIREERYRSFMLSIENYEKLLNE